MSKSLKPQIRSLSLDAIRNFAIIAHIDHGKTTLTDKLLKITKTISPKDTADRILDSNPIEKERGITIKLAPVTMTYKLQATSYKLNLIDTPGHVDFSYEVSRSLAACEGVVLLIDASQGIQAQSVAHASKAIDLGLTIIPAINKVDLKSARISETLSQLQEIMAFKDDQVIQVSAKTGEGVETLLQRLIENLPSPKGENNKPLRALVFNSIYDSHLGVIVFIKIVDGNIKSQQKLNFLKSNIQIESKEIGIFTPSRTPLEGLSTGEVGYIATGLKDIQALKIGDTITELMTIKKKDKVKSLPGFQLPKPVVYADVFPSHNTRFNELNKAVTKLMLTDSALSLSQIHSKVFGSGLRLGFLGLFHSEITRERLQREHQIDTLFTHPTVEYIVTTSQGQIIKVLDPSELPDPSQIVKIKEPMTKVTILIPRQHIGRVLRLLQDRRGRYQDTQFLSSKAKIIYNLPLAELINGFVDKLKSVSQGYATIDYEHIDSEPADVIKLSILINRQELEPLSRIVVRQDVQRIGREIVTKLKEQLPRQLFAVPIQAAVGGKIIARETKPAARKDVTAKLYGGDRTRRMKLIEKQKKGKKKLALVGKVNIPPETYAKLLKI